MQHTVTHILAEVATVEEATPKILRALGEWLGWDVTLVRVAYVVVSILSVAFPGILVYLILWAVMPRAAA